ncbi:MAG: tetratricopeptide repeat protein [Prevotella ruminicola]|jgi:outer membrane protein OmpA-like peptidoglycan-associated protein/tetratricopeptide (TPR) repeat protein|uniref:Tetratricopeptide repeat protein n=1 Tax=Xylanibacter ruminicola TaxID=839 RepID=A0A928BR44_XYLRU|nr:tetratricopeptide repeat protein [Xylanibacter ruminicola]
MYRFRRIAYVICVALLLGSCGAEQAVKKGDKFWAVGEYFDAAEQYKKAYTQTPSKERTTRGQRAKKLAECYRHLNQTNKAISAYNNVVRYKQADSLTHFYLGQLYMRNGNYKEAAKQYTVAIDSLRAYGDSLHLQLAKVGLESAQKAPQWKKEGSAYTIKKMDLFNSRRDDYSPMLAGDSNDQLFLTSTRNQAQGDELNGITGTKNADIFFSQKNEKGKWGKPQVIASELNSVYDEGACCFSPDGKTMYLTQCVTDPNYPRYAKIMVSNRSDASWSKPKELVIAHDTLSSFAHPAVSPDGEWLYFVSDMPGGMGGLDIWRCRILNNGNDIGYAENAGEKINTSGDEMFPTFRPNGDLYFSSNGHPGLGGLDIYFIPAKSQHPTPTIQHPGFPLNSQADDFGMTFEGKLNQGFFCSNRGDLRGFDHIYSFYNPEIIQTVKGWVYEQDGYELTAAQVYMVGNDGTNLKLSVRSDGSFTQEITPGVDYVILGTCKGYLNHQEQIRVEPSKKSEEHVLQFPLANISAPVLIENIFYDFNKATLRPESQKALDELVQLLNENPNVTIELSAHTDSRGSDAYNEQLSQRRAESVVAYLIAHGIAADRLTPKGYGETAPKRIKKRVAEKYEFLKEGDVLTEEFIAALPEELQEQCHQMNRRTEFKVLRTTYGMFDKAGKLIQSPATTPQTKD